MILKAANSLPQADHWIFICREEHIRDYNIDRLLHSEYPGSKIIAVDYLTEGQASTCLLAESYVNEDEPLLIGACDNGATWNKEKYRDLMKDGDMDAIIWTFRNNITVQRNPHMYGWVIVDDKNNAIKVSCKAPVSGNPVNDHAIVGTFYFKKAKFFMNAAKNMIEKKRRVNNEFYVDELMNELMENSLKVKVFEVDKYIGWGTPDDFRTYCYWEGYFKKTL